ncbi:MAG TPA: heavy metal-associated domain-containing protein [Candidatus Onthovivens sp.]|nr:heavy metal-associated domain-containing protein [Candidatus Onthovivens sp.]
MERRFMVQGMMCEGCLNSLRSRLEVMDDLKIIKLDLTDKELIVDSPYSEEEIIKAIESVGFYTN